MNRSQLALLCIFATSCGSSAAPIPDAHVADAQVADAGPPDSGPPFVLFARCQTDSDCHGDANAVCGTSFPGGVCTTTCSADTDCGDAGGCFRGYCLPMCTSGGGECAAFQGACVPDRTRERLICTASCEAPDHLAPGEIPCNTGLACDPWLTYCRDPATLPTTGGEDGDPCIRNSDCKSTVCASEVDATTGLPTGFIGGMCISFGTQPPASAYVAGMPLPRSNCVAGSAMAPPLGGFSPPEGDWVTCYAECTGDTDCRAGYFCFRAGNATPLYATGVCLPVLCDLPGMECPAGYACQIQGGLSLCAAIP